MREICVDTETTGLNPYEGHKVVEIGCVEILNGKRTGKTLHFYINPEREIPEEATEIHGITNEFVKDKPIFKDIAQEFLDFLGEDGVLIAHNSAFDTGFLNFELIQIGFEKIKNKTIDSLQVAKIKFPGQKNSLDALCKRFNIDSSHRLKHGALLDAELLADVYFELTGGSQKNIFDTNREDSESNSYKTENFEKLLNEIKTKKQLVSRRLKCSEAEEAKHQEFVNKNFPSSSWYKKDETPNA